MRFPHSPPDYSSTNLEKAALLRFRSSIPDFPPECKVWRERSGDATVLHLDFASCPQKLSVMMKNFVLLALVAHRLGLSESIVFHIGNQIEGWTRISEN